MRNTPLQYVLRERKSVLGKLKGKTVIQAMPTGRKRISHRNFCDEVARATTFTGAEVEAVLRLAAEIAKKHVENGNIVDFGDIGTLKPSFKTVVRLAPSKEYFELRGVSFERVEPQPKKKKKDDGASAGPSTSSGTDSTSDDNDPGNLPGGHPGL